MIDLNKEAELCAEIARTRENHGGIEGDPLKACGEEIVEAAVARERLLDAVVYNLYNQSDIEERRTEYADELADVCICAMHAASQEDIDLEAAIYRKIEQNRARAEKRGDKL